MRASEQASLSLWKMNELDGNGRLVVDVDDDDCSLLLVMTAQGKRKRSRS